MSNIDLSMLVFESSLDVVDVGFLDKRADRAN